MQFQIDGTNFGSAVTLTSGSPTSGSTTSLTGGYHIITALYSGDGNYSSGADSAIQQVKPWIHYFPEIYRYQ